MRILRDFLRQRYLEIVILYVAVQLLLVPLTGWLDEHAWVSVLLAFLVLGVLALLLDHAERRRRRRESLGHVASLEQPGRRAVIILLSPLDYSESVCQLVMEHEGITHVGFLSTAKVEIEGHLEGYRSRAASLGKTLAVATCDPDDVRDIGVQTRSLIDRMMRVHGLGKHEIVVDITHGTTIMSVGAFIAADQVGLECRYLASDVDAHGRRVEGTQRAVILVGSGPASA